MSKQFAILVGLVSIISCTSMQLESDGDYRATAALLRSVAKKCDEHMDNKPMARKVCFPQLEGKSLFMRLTEVEDKFGLTLMGQSEDYRVWCQPGKAAAEKLVKQPETLKIGAKYKVQGNFTNYRSGYLTFFTLSECKFENVEDQKK